MGCLEGLAKEPQLTERIVPIRTPRSSLFGNRISSRQNLNSDNSIFLSRAYETVEIPGKFRSFDSIYVHPNIRQFIRDILVAVQYHPKIWLGPLLHVEELMKIVSQLRAV